jgi:exosortase
MSSFLMSDCQQMHLKSQEIVVVLYRGATKVGAEPDPVQLTMLVKHLAGNDTVRRLVVSAYKPGDMFIPSGVEPCGAPEIEWIGEDVCAGNASRLRSVFQSDKENLIVALPMDLMTCPPVEELAKIHFERGACLTVFENPATRTEGEHSGVFVLDGSVIDFIPEYGYWDIEENLIPELLVLGKDVCQAIITSPLTRLSGGRDRRERISEIQQLLINSSDPIHMTRSDDQAVVWSGDGSRIAESARVYGTVVLQDGVSVEDKAVLIGPAILMSGVSIGHGAVVLPGIVKDSVPDRTVSEGDIQTPCDLYEIGRQPVLGESVPLNMSLNLGWLAACTMLLGVCIWSYMPVIRELWDTWMRSDEYSSGLLVPFLAVYVLLTRRQQLRNITVEPALILGCIALLVSQAARFMGLYYMYLSAERLSFVMAIWALVLWLAGRKWVLRIPGVLLFLLLMLPLPNRVQSSITLPLQKWSTTSAVFCLEMCGYPVMSEGNIIQIGDTRVAVAEACNGLRMITAFFVIGALVALLTKRSWWEKLIILASCLPIALICNTLRLAVTAVAFTLLSGEHWEQLFHDFGGYAMMPLALALVILQLYLLQRLFLHDEVIEKSIVMRTAGPRHLN